MERKILIVEDEAPYIKTYIDFFKGKPYKVLQANNAQLGLDMVIEHRPDLIIMDWNMPGMTGLEATQKLTDLGITEDTPIIMATGVMVSSEHLEIALEAGAYDFVRKPLDLVELNARINSAFKLSDSFQRIKKLMKIEKEYLETKIERQSRELFISSSVKQNIAQGLSDIESDLNRINLLGNDNIKVYVKSIRQKISGFSDSERTWEDFKIHFEQVNPKFFDKLHVLHPQLTIYETRLCAYLKMGLGNKEIAQVCHIHPNSVKKSVSRLRKKLELAPENHLREYIAEF